MYLCMYLILFLLFINVNNINKFYLPVSINALTGNPLTLQLIYNITTDPNVSGLYSIAASIFASIFFCLISSAINLWASVSNGSAFIILNLCASRSSLNFICSLSTVVNFSTNQKLSLEQTLKFPKYFYILLHISPRLPDSKALASLGLFWLSNANWSGLAKNMSRIISGSSSFLGFCILAIVLLEADGCRLLDAPGTVMELKSNMGIARVMYLQI